MPKMKKLGNAIRQGNSGVVLRLALCLARGSVRPLMFYKGQNVLGARSVSIPRGKVWKLPTELGSISRAGIIRWIDDI
jgi:hypothetical protein